jgi:hypothetical protein
MPKQELGFTTDEHLGGCKQFQQQKLHILKGCSSKNNVSNILVMTEFLK